MGEGIRWEAPLGSVLGANNNLSVQEELRGCGPELTQLPIYQLPKNWWQQGPRHCWAMLPFGY